MTNSYIRSEGRLVAAVGLDNVVLTPHIAGSTRETWREAFDLTLANLAAHFTGKKLLTPVQF